MHGRIIADAVGVPPRLFADHVDGQGLILCDGAGGKPKNGSMESVDIGDILDD